MAQRGAFAVAPTRSRSANGVEFDHGAIGLVCEAAAKVVEFLDGSQEIGRILAEPIVSQAF